MKNSLFTLLLIVFLISGFSYSQISLGVSSPDASAILDLTSNSKGLLVSRMSTAQRNAANGILSPTGGIVIFDTDTNCLWISLESGLWKNACNKSEVATTSGTTTSVGKVGIDTSSPDNNTIIDIVSTSKGVLLPKSSINLANITGMLYYNTSDDTVRIYNGTAWVTLITN